MASTQISPGQGSTSATTMAARTKQMFSRTSQSTREDTDPQRMYVKSVSIELLISLISIQVMLCSPGGLAYCHKDALHKHVAMLHPDPNGEALICEVCSKSFSNRFSLRNHKKSTHRSRDFACKLCEKKFKLKVALRQHMIRYKTLHG